MPKQQDHAEKQGEKKSGILKNRKGLTLCALLLAIGIFSFLGIRHIYKEPPPSVLVVEEGLPPIGGAFELIDKDRQVWTNEDFKGKPMMIYFGYSYCPDICPTALYAMTQALDMLGGAGAVQPVFVTMDPERDTPEQLALYAQNFHKDFVMLTGSKAQIDKAKKAYLVHGARASEEDGSKDYLIDHSSIIYFMDGKGQYQTHCNHSTPATEIVEKIRSLLKQRMP